MYEKQLLGAGLDEKQVKVYLACLVLGPTKVPEIARKAEVKRTTAYGIIDELVSRGLLSKSIKGKNYFFCAQDPSILVEILENNKKEIQNILPNLKEIYSSYHHRPQVQYFEGREGVKRIYEDTLECKSKKIYQIVRVKDFIDYPGGKFSEEYIKKRVAKGIEAFALHPKSDDIHDRIYGTESDELKRHVRYLPPNAFYASMIMIYDNKVAMIGTKEENFGFIIESREFSSTLLAYFQFMWGLGSKEPETN